MCLFAELPAPLSVPLLGKDYLCQFLITIDFPNHKIRFVPYEDAQFVKDLFSFGLNLGTGDDLTPSQGSSPCVKILLDAKHPQRFRAFSDVPFSENTKLTKLAKTRAEIRKQIKGDSKSNALSSLGVGSK